MSSPKILLLDIETAPNKAYVWGLFRQNIANNQVEESSYVLCWSAKHLGESEAEFSSLHSHTRRQMLKRVHQYLDAADIVVHYNGQKFDIPVLNKEFVQQKMTPPSPYKQVDLMLAVKRAFRFESNKLDFVAKALGIGAKKKHEGFTLWTSCMNGDPEAWKRMEEYNRGDVDLLEKLYPILLPWIPKHPNLAGLLDVDSCPKCGSKRFQKRGNVVTVVLSYTRYQCRDCGGWFRGTKTTSPRKPSRMVNV